MFSEDIQENVYYVPILDMLWCQIDNIAGEEKEQK